MECKNKQFRLILLFYFLKERTQNRLLRSYVMCMVRKPQRWPNKSFNRIESSYYCARDWKNIKNTKINNRPSYTTSWIFGFHMNWKKFIQQNASTFEICILNAMNSILFWTELSLVMENCFLVQATTHLLWMIYDIIYFRKRTALSKEKV